MQAQKTPQLTPVWSPWRIASGAHGKRTWWILRENTAERQESSNGMVYGYVQREPYETTDGRLRQYLTDTAAQKVADKLNATSV